MTRFLDAHEMFTAKLGAGYDQRKLTEAIHEGDVFCERCRKSACTCPPVLFGQTKHPFEMYDLKFN